MSESIDSSVIEYFNKKGINYSELLEFVLPSDLPRDFYSNSVMRIAKHFVSKGLKYFSGTDISKALFMPEWKGDTSENLRSKGKKILCKMFGNEACELSSMIETPSKSKRKIISPTQILRLESGAYEGNLRDILGNVSFIPSEKDLRESRNLPVMISNGSVKFHPDFPYFYGASFGAAYIEKPDESKDFSKFSFKGQKSDEDYYKSILVPFISDLFNLDPKYFIEKEKSTTGGIHERPTLLLDSLAITSFYLIHLGFPRSFKEGHNVDYPIEKLKSVDQINEFLSGIVDADGYFTDNGLRLRGNNYSYLQSFQKVAKKYHDARSSLMPSKNPYSDSLNYYGEECTKYKLVFDNKNTNKVVSNLTLRNPKHFL